MIGYILISYGPRPTGHVRTCKAARQQIRNLRHLAQNLPNKPHLRMYHDYARTITTLSSLPVLKNLLERAKERNAVIFSEDLRSIALNINRLMCADRNQAKFNPIQNRAATILVQIDIRMQNQTVSQHGLNGCIL